MADRSETQRQSAGLRAVATRVAALCAALVFVATGCQSNAQQDLVIREMRTQEDQLYAMEDYLAQYQQLICKYRSENAELRRQLSEGGSSSTEAELPAPQSPTRRGSTPPASSAPTFQPPSTPSSPAPTPANESPAPPPESGVPPLDLSSQLGLNGTGVVPASATMPVEESIETVPPQQIELRGQIVRSEADGTRKLLVDVTGFDASGATLPVSGNLSLLLAPPGTNGQQILARWDMRNEEVQASIVDPNVPTAQLALDLPPEVALGGPVELWARLLPRGGSKLLSSIQVDPQQTMTVAAFDAPPPLPESMPQYHMDSEVVAAQYTEPVNELRSEQATEEVNESPLPQPSYDLVDAGWSTAKPGEPGESKKEGLSDSQWRASNEEPPVAIAGNTATSRPQRADRTRKVASKSTTPLEKPNGWSPDRPSATATKNIRTATAPRRPSWSADR